jgi:hypothetical protein
MRYATHHEPQDEPYLLTAANLDQAIYFGDRPILRSLSSMTEGEKLELYKELYGDDAYSVIRLKFNLSTDSLSPNGFCYLLSKHFDLFGLIENKLAINK